MANDPPIPSLLMKGSPSKSPRDIMGTAGSARKGRGTQGTNAQQDAQGRPTQNPTK